MEISFFFFFFGRFTSQCDWFTEWSSTIPIDCCHLEGILSVWSKTIDSTTCCCYWPIPLHISVGTTSCIIPHNIAGNGPILLDTRYFSPPEGYFSGLYKRGLQWLWSSWGNWVYRSADLPTYQPKSVHSSSYTCCEGCYIHWTSREHSAFTKPSLVDSKSIVYAFLESIEGILLLVRTESALVKISPTCSTVIDVILLCVAGRQPCQMYWGGRHHGHCNIWWTCVVDSDKHHVTTVLQIAQPSMQVLSIPCSRKNAATSLLCSPAVATTVMV